MNSQIPANMPQPIFQSATEAFASDSDTPIPVRVGQLNENVPVLTREEYRRQAAIQKQKDAEAEAASKIPPPVNLSPVRPPPPNKPSGARPSGKQSRARRTTLHPALNTSDAVIEDRIAKIEAGQARTQRALDTVIEILSRQPAVETREEESKEVDDAAPRGLDSNRQWESDVEKRTLADASEPDDDAQDLCDTFMGSEGPELNPFEPGDPNLARMQAYIQRKTPLKDFRRAWQAMCPRGGFQEWPNAMQARFTELFNTIILHPKMLAQVRRTVLTFRNGQCMGEEQMYKLLVMLAGNCALYSIITAEV